VAINNSTRRAWDCRALWLKPSVEIIIGRAWSTDDTYIHGVSDSRSFRFHILHEKNGFAGVSKNIAQIADLKMILLNHQNTYVECLSVDNNLTKSFNIPVRHNYFGWFKIIFRSASS